MQQERTISLIIIGDEIISGKRQDKHLQQVATLLKPKGLMVNKVTMVGDDSDFLTTILQQSFKTNHIVFCFGGIGSTPDDRTRQCAAKALKLPIKRHAKAASIIEQKLGDKAYPQPITMADYPQGAAMIPNFYNQIPGFSIKEHYFMPGFPIMAKDMVAWILNHYYKDLIQPVISEKSIKIINGRESQWVVFMQQFEITHPALKIFSLPTITENDGRNVEIGVAGLEPLITTGYQQIITKAKDLKVNFVEI